MLEINSPTVPEWLKWQVMTAKAGWKEPTSLPITVTQPKVAARARSGWTRHNVSDLAPFGLMLVRIQPNQ